MFIGILLNNIQKPDDDPLRRACLFSCKPLVFAALLDSPSPAYATASDISIYLLLRQTRRDPRGCSNEISNSPWKLGRHWKWIERANNTEYGGGRGGWRALRRSGGEPDGWRQDLVAAFVSARGRRGWNSEELEAHFDVRTEHDFTALTGDARNALDNPTSALDLLDPFPLSSPSSHPIDVNCINGPDELHAVNSVCDNSVFGDKLRQFGIWQS